MVVHPKTLWAAYGPTDGSLSLQVQGVLRDLQGRLDLNGQVVKILKWDGLSGRFAVQLKSTGERIKVKVANLRPEGEVTPSLQSDSHLGPLDVELELAVASFLQSRSVGMLSAISRALRAALWLRADAQPLWENLVVRKYGPMALEVIRRTHPTAIGPGLYRRVRGLRDVFRETFEVVRGGVDKNAKDFEVVACPTLHEPSMSPPIGANGAVRLAAGEALDEAIAALSTPLPELSTTLVTGGRLSEKVALVVTAPPRTLHEGDRGVTMGSIVCWMRQLHENLLREVRSAGYRSVVMPTLATGGIGVPPHVVAIGAVQAIHNDLLTHPLDPIHVRIACFETSHIPAVNVVKDEMLDMFYRPDEALELLMANLTGSTTDS